MKKNSTEVPQASLKLRRFLIPMVVLIALLSLFIVTISKPAPQPAKVSKSFSQTDTPTSTAFPTAPLYQPVHAMGEPVPTLHYATPTSFEYVPRDLPKYIYQCFTTIIDHTFVTHCAYYMDARATSSPAATQSESPPIEEIGWIETLSTGSVTLEHATPTTLSQLILFHGTSAKGDGVNCKGCYVLELLPSVKFKSPMEDLDGKDIIFHPGESYQYLIKGSLSEKTVDGFFLGSLPIFEVAYLERVK